MKNQNGRFRKDAKDYGGKLRYDILKPEFMEDIVKVLSYGHDKYGDYNWQKCKKTELFWYEGALFRHFQEYRKGNIIDEDSGFTHLSHAATNLYFLDWYWRTKHWTV